MHKLYDLKEKLCDQLEEYADKDLTAGSLDVVDKLTHTIKNLDKIIEKCEEDEYSNTYNDDMSMRGGSYMRGDNRGSYARGGRRNVRRDSMGRYSGEMHANERGYSRNDGIISDLHELMNEAPDEKSRMEIQKLIQKMEQM